MDFTNRSTESSATSEAENTSQKSSGNNPDRSKWGRLGVAIMGAAIVVLLVALVAFISFSGNNNENNYVDSSKLQAVSLNNGQLYFGNITALNNKYFVLTNIYYLKSTTVSTTTTNTTKSNGNTAASNVTVVKLGCEVHKPYDQMIINSDQVTFWENLQANGQVAKAVAAFQKQNPNGLKCTDQSSLSSGTSTNTTQDTSTSGTTTTTNSSTSTTSKPSGN